MKTDIVAPNHLTEKLILISLYEKHLKQLKTQLRDELPAKATFGSSIGKVTVSSASRIKIDKEGLYTLLVSKDINPLDWGKCEVTISETKIEQLISSGVLTTEEVEQFVSETTYETMRVTPDKNVMADLEAEILRPLGSTMDITTKMYLLGEDNE
jgi:hypothetical protein